MNSTLMKIAFAYLAGIGTYALIQNYNILKRLDAVIAPVELSETDTSATMKSSATMRTMAMAPTGLSCPCDNEDRYDVTHILESQNIPIPKIPDCETMVHAGNPSGGPGTPEGVGAWFSKITIDNMFCNKPDANGIFVYRALTASHQITYVIEAARTEYISSTDDGVSYIYYSRAMCPTLCGECMW